LLQVFGADRTFWSARVPGDASRLIVVIDDAADSQFDAMVSALQRGLALPDRLVALALTGRGFRGQRQRPWSALRGNLHLTSHYIADLDASRDQAALSMIPAIASAEAIIRVSRGAVAPVIKWVNDVLVHGAKVSGVLTATSISSAMIDRVTFGIGMNIAQAPDIDPTPFVPAAGCLGAEDPDLKDALPAIFHEVVDLLDELMRLVMTGRSVEVFERYRALAGFIGQDVTIWPEGTEDWKATTPVCRGQVLELLPDLSLRISGRIEPVARGRMALATA
jgi:biotin-(acetyl-CoA carboxylase) ligase